MDRRRFMFILFGALLGDAFMYFTFYRDVELKKSLLVMIVATIITIIICMREKKPENMVV